MVFNAVFNSVSVISQWPVHLSMLSRSSFNHYSAQYFFQTTGCFPTQPLSKQRKTVRGMNPVAMTIINPWKEYWQSRGWNQRPPVFKSATLPTELWGKIKVEAFAKISSNCLTLFYTAFFEPATSELHTPVITD